MERVWYRLSRPFCRDTESCRYDGESATGKEVGQIYTDLYAELVRFPSFSPFISLRIGPYIRSYCRTRTCGVAIHRSISRCGYLSLYHFLVYTRLKEHY